MVLPQGPLTGPVTSSHSVGCGARMGGTVSLLRCNIKDQFKTFRPISMRGFSWGPGLSFKGQRRSGPLTARAHGQGTMRAARVY